MKLEGKRVVITGASSGIGLELLKMLLEEGCTVVACARRIEKVGISDPRLFLKKCDVSQREELDDLFAFSLKKWALSISLLQMRVLPNLRRWISRIGSISRPFLIRM